jgi:hypothetical protein
MLIEDVTAEDFIEYLINLNGSLKHNIYDPP